MDYLSKIFWNEGLKYANHNTDNSNITGNRRFRSFYGISPEALSILWELIPNKPPRSQPKHLLWCMLFLKNYNKEHINAALVDVDEKTFRLWTWKFVELLAELNVVKWDNRLKNSNGDMHVSLDGTDFRITEPKPFSKKGLATNLKGQVFDMKSAYLLLEGKSFGRRVDFRVESGQT